MSWPKRAPPAEKAAINEYRRLLYVAMTRAAERLVVCGAQGPNKIPDGCWYELVEEALRNDCVAEPADDGSGEVLRYRKGEAPAAKRQGRSRAHETSFAAAPGSRATPQPIQPSAAQRHAVERDRRGDARPRAARRRRSRAAARRR